MMPSVVYLDTCCTIKNRLTTPTMISVSLFFYPRKLYQAMTSIFTLIDTNEVRWVASTLLTGWRSAEIPIRTSENPTRTRSCRPQVSYCFAHERHVHSQRHSFNRMAAFPTPHLPSKTPCTSHLLLAEQAHADWFVTTDDRIRTPHGDQHTSLPECVNPVDWLRRRKLWLVPKQ